MLALFSLLLAGIVGVVAAAPASAGVLSPAITGVTFSHVHDNDGDGVLDPVTDENPLYKDSSFKLEIGFTLSAPLAVGDTFQVTLPDELQGHANSGFPLVSDGVEIGTCTIDPGNLHWDDPSTDSGGPRPSSFRCELTNAVVASWETLEPFSLRFDAVAISSTESSTLPFTASGADPYFAPTPGGGIQVGEGLPQPTSTYKTGWANAGNPGQMHWVIYLAGYEGDSGAISMVDTLDPTEGQDLVPTSFRVSRTDDWNPQDPYANSRDVGPGVYDLSVAGDRLSFDLSFPAQPGATVYWVEYDTNVPPDV